MLRQKQSEPKSGLRPDTSVLSQRAGKESERQDKADFKNPLKIISSKRAAKTTVFRPYSQFISLFSGDVNRKPTNSGKVQTMATARPFRALPFRPKALKIFLVGAAMKYVAPKVGMKYIRKVQMYLIRLPFGSPRSPSH